jgi:hypothetical protein
MFYGCTALTSFTIPSMVSTISNAAFTSSGLTSIIIPSTVLTIGDLVFFNCASLTTATFDNGAAFSSLGNSTFRGCTLLASVTLGNRVTTIADNMFQGCTSLTSFTIPSTVSAIGTSAFQASGLTSITIPNTVLTIVDNAFYNCTSLTTATFESGSTAFSSIGVETFRNCTSLSSVTLGNRVTTITINMFYSCTSLTSFTIPSTVLSIGDNAFAGSRLTSITIPNTVLTIGNSTFSSISTLTSATFDSGSTAFSSLGSNIFSNCTSLSSVTLGNRVTTITTSMFQSCTSLTSFAIPSTVSTIGTVAFNNTGLTSITIPNTVNSIGDSVFRGIPTLTSATFENGTAFSSLGTNIFNNCTSLASVTLGNRVTTIADSMFQSCTSLTSFTIPSTVSAIGGGSFIYSRLTSITIPNTVLTIGSDAFYDVPTLTTVTFDSGSTAFSSLAGNTFNNCPNLATVTLGNRVTTISNGMFQGCTSLTSFTIPRTVSAIGTNAFSGCANLLTVTFSGLSLPAISSPNFTAAGDTAIVFSNATPVSNITPYFTNIEYIVIPVRCFREDSKILCLVDNKEIYLPIQDVHKGVLVKTHRSGYVPVNMIGNSKIYNPGNKSRSKERLYKCTPSNYPELTEDLYITGCHSILVSHLTDEQKEMNNELLGRIMVTENKYRLMTCIDDRAEPYDCEGLYNIWHLALDHDDERMNYGIYANGGLLVETTSKRMLLNYSSMNIL